MTGFSLIADDLGNSVLVAVDLCVVNNNAKSVFNDLVASHNSAAYRAAVIVLDRDLILDPVS